jgi:hypothetical protein
MSTTHERSVLLLGRSRRILDEAIAALRDLGYSAEGTNDFADVTARFDTREIDLIVFGGQVPPDRKAELEAEIGALNPDVIVVEGLSGIPGLIVNQIQGAFAAREQHTVDARFTPDGRTIRFDLARPARVQVHAWWQTSFVPPDPKSDSLLLLDYRLDAGEHELDVPDRVPTRAAFATVQAGPAVAAFSIATDR